MEIGPDLIRKNSKPKLKMWSWLKHVIEHISIAIRSAINFLLADIPAFLNVPLCSVIINEFTEGFFIWSRAFLFSNAEMCLYVQNDDHLIK